MIDLIFVVFFITFLILIYTVDSDLTPDETTMLEVISSDMIIRNNVGIFEIDEKIFSANLSTATQSLINKGYLRFVNEVQGRVTRYRLSNKGKKMLEKRLKQRAKNKW